MEIMIIEHYSWLKILLFWKSRKKRNKHPFFMDRKQKICSKKSTSFRNVNVVKSIINNVDKNGGWLILDFHNIVKGKEMIKSKERY